MRYARAATLTPDHINALMRNRSIEPHWTGDGDTFWYKRQSDGDDVADEYVLVDPVAAKRTVFSTYEELALAASDAPARPGVLRSPDG